MVRALVVMLGALWPHVTILVDVVLVLAEVAPLIIVAGVFVCVTAFGIDHSGVSRLSWCSAAHKPSKKISNVVLLLFGLLCETSLARSVLKVIEIAEPIIIVLIFMCISRQCWHVQ